MKTFVPLAAALVISVAAPSLAQQAPQGWRTLSGAEVQAVIQSHRVGGINHLGQPYLMTYQPGGVVAGITRVAQTGGTATDAGKWAIEGNQLCVQMNNWRNGARSCSFLHTNGSQYRRTSADGVLYLTPDVHFDQVPWNGAVWAGQ